MIEYKYEIWCLNEKIAGDMTLENAVLFLKSYLFEYYEVRDMEVSIRRKAPE